MAVQLTPETRECGAGRSPSSAIKSDNDFSRAQPRGRSVCQLRSWTMPMSFFSEIPGLPLNIVRSRSGAVHTQTSSALQKGEGKRTSSATSQHRCPLPLAEVSTDWCAAGRVPVERQRLCSRSCGHRKETMRQISFWPSEREITSTIVRSPSCAGFRGCSLGQRHHRPTPPCRAGKRRPTCGPREG